MYFCDLSNFTNRPSLESDRPSFAANRATHTMRILLALSCGLASAITAHAAAPPDSIRDSFNRSDGAVGGSWVGDLANASISAGQLVVPGPTGLSYAYYNRTLPPTQYVHATIKTPAGTSVPGQSVTLRGQPNNSRIQVTVVSSGRVGVKTITDGVWSGYLASTPATFVAGDKITASMDLAGTLSVYKNGAPILTTSLSTWKYASSSGYVGISGYVGMAIDDFGFGTWSSVAPVNRPPIAAASGTLTVSLSGAGSSDPDNDPLSYAWDFGDGSTGTGQFVTHAYGTAGSYTARLTVSDGHGGSTSSIVSVALTNPVQPAPPPAPLSLSLSFHVPATNDSTLDCVTHRSGPTQSDSVMTHWRISPLGVEDSTLAARGALVTKSYTVSGASQTIVAWVSRWGRASGGPVYLRSCDTAALPVTAHWVAQIADLIVRDSDPSAPAGTVVNGTEQPITR